MIIKERMNFEKSKRTKLCVKEDKESKSKRKVKRNKVKVIYKIIKIEASYSKSVHIVK